MENKANGLSGSALVTRCPYLGLHDDSATSLAFPSTWNYCYRARPPAPVLLSQQTKACLGPGYANCPVYLRKETGALPSNLRGSSSPVRTRRHSRRTRAALLILILIFLAAGAFLFGDRLLQYWEINPVITNVTASPTSTLEATASRRA